MRVLGAVLAAISLLQGGAFETFSGYQVVQVETATKEAHQLVNLWIEQHPEADVWQYPVLGGFAHINLPKDELEKFQLPYTVFVEDVESAIRKTYVRSKSQSWHEEYHPLEEINDFVRDKVVRYQNNTVLKPELFDIGDSWENRVIYGIKFGGGGNPNPVRIVWNGIHHAREWIGPATLMYIMDRLFEGVDSDPRIANILRQTEFHVLPVLNPDGYEYTWTNNRMWRKTRSTYNSAIGTDPNRNWDFQWGGAGASTFPFSETYRGPRAFSEPEVEQWAKYIGTLTNVGGYIDWHSYGNYILGAWGYTSTLPDDYTAQNTLAARMNEAIRAVNGRSYTFGPSGATLYPTSGSAPDYTYGVNGIVYSYTIELPGQPGGFALPPEYIIGVGQESLAGALIAVEAALADVSAN